MSKSIAVIQLTIGICKDNLTNELRGSVSSWFTQERDQVVVANLDSKTLMLNSRSVDPRFV